MFDRRLIQYFDWGLLGVVALLGIVGLVALYSAVSAGITPQQTLYTKQLIWYAIGLCAMVVTFLFNYKALERWGHIIYIGCIVLLIAVLLWGKMGGGSKRWLVFGPVSVQPSEVVKIGVIIMLARFYSKVADMRGLVLRDLVTPAMITVIPFLLIVRQPDLGTAMLVLLIAGSVTIFVKIERRTLICIIFSGMTAVPLVWSMLKGYQQQRIMTFLDPERDPLGAGYHIIQSKIAIGSGMLTGKGFLKGTQNALYFLPEQHTDFIFSVLSEEWGFAGSLAVLLLFLVFLVWALTIAHGCRDAFGTILALGVTAMIFWQVAINIGMVMGLMPVVGVPLPFISYGGSSIVTTMMCVGILMNVSMRRFLFE